MSAIYTGIFIGIAVALLAGYFAPKYMPLPKPKIVGIDLGTTSSCIGVYQPGSGEVTVLQDADNNKCIPSVVAFVDGKIYIGHAAAKLAAHHPTTTVYDAKRFIGKTMSKETLATESERYPFRMKHDEKGFIIFDLPQYTGQQPLTPEYIGSLILGELKCTAEMRLNRAVSLGVMSVPAEFDQQQINATGNAAKMAGLEILRFITEPTAAALAYGLHTIHLKKEQHKQDDDVDEDDDDNDALEDMTMAMIVDLGGGTLDVSVLSVQRGMFVTQSLAGNNKLGGQDFNERLHAYCHNDIRKFIGEKLKKNQITSFDNADLESELRSGVETLKRALTSGEDAKLNIILPKEVTGESKDLDYEIKVRREEFESVNSDLFDSVLEPIRRSLNAIDLSPLSIDTVVLVGGSTRVPRIRELIRQHFSGKQLDTRIEPELAVTVGVSTQAGVIGGAWPLAVGAIESPSTARPKKINV